jgi:hypothetical protein
VTAGRFAGETPSTFLERMRRPVVVDGRRIYNVDEFSSAEISFLGIGRGPKAS